MAARDAWILVLAAGVVMQALRWLPVLILRWRGEELPAPMARFLECAGLATIGGLIALPVFPPGASPPPPGDAGVKMAALALAFVSYLWLRSGTLCLLLAYGAYVCLTLVVK
jgi:hypothetical protein